MKTPSPRPIDHRIHELLQHLRSDLFHAFLGLAGLAFSLVFESHLGETLSLAYIAGSLLVTAYRYLRRRALINRLIKMSSKYLRPAWPTDFGLIQDIDCGWLASDRAAVISGDTLASWAEVDPATFWVHLDEAGQVKGYFAIVNMKSRTFALFKDGAISEPELRKKDFRPLDYRAKELYFFSIAYRDGQGSRQAKNVLLRKAAEQIEHLRTAGSLERIFASAASPAGRHMIERLPFVKVMDAKLRKDKHDLYLLDLTGQETRELVGKLGVRGR